MTPEGLALVEKQRHAENVIGRRLFLGSLVCARPLAGQIFVKLVSGKIETRD